MKKYPLWIVLLFGSRLALAHPMPGSVVKLFIGDQAIRGEARIPLLELGNAVGDERLSHLNDPFFRRYFRAHIRAVSGDQGWNTVIDSISESSSRDPIVGNFREVAVHFTLRPLRPGDLRHFDFLYDAVIHQVVTHSALVYIQQDWNNGLQPNDDARQAGIIKLDIPSGKILPLAISLDEGSWWKGTASMAGLGMNHIREGTDHLLFLVALLLPVMLRAQGRRWGPPLAIRKTVPRLFAIITAFTIGHSLTLLLGALQWVKAPAQPVEILIAVSVLASAVHAFRPVFPGKELLIAGGFGLVHGLAFATVLSGLQLGAGKMALSILSFNIGIELMQLWVMALILPSLLLLSRTPAYRWIRPAGAMMAGMAAVAWIFERTTGRNTIVTPFVESAATHGLWIAGGLAGLSIAAFGIFVLKREPVQEEREKMEWVGKGA